MGVVAVGLACLLATVRMDSAFDMFQRIVGLTGSGLGGLFVLGIFTRRANLRGAMTGAITSAIALYWMQGHTRAHVYLYSLVGICVCVAVGYLASLAWGAAKPDAAAQGVSHK